MNANESFCHPSADVKTSAIGGGTSIWQFCVVLAGAKIGAHCNICSHCFIENDVVIGDEVTVKCGVQLWDGIVLEDRVFVGPNVTFTNDSDPRSRVRKSPERTIVRKGASIGANATVLPGIEIGEYAMIGAGSVVTEDVLPRALVLGNPARVRGWFCTCGSKMKVTEAITTLACTCGSQYRRVNGGYVKQAV